MKTTTKQPFITRTSLIQRLSYLLLSFMLVLGLGLMSCEGPTGDQGAKGDKGDRGAIGPAGEDGSVMYADEGAPGDNIGQNGDYYLNQNTGELYGPKTNDGWGEPGIVLKGEDGQDGTDGQDGAGGQDGEDGSQILSGNGAPNGSLGAAGDYYLDQDNYELYGPKTSNGWGTPLNLKGANGNANVTRYIFPGHNYVEEFLSSHEIDVTEAEMEESAWEVYLVRSVIDGIDAYHVPGFAPEGSQYGVFYTTYGDANNQIMIHRVDGPGDAYDNIYIVRIEASSTEDYTKRAGDSIIPDHLDVSNYEEVAKYYGFDGDQ